MSRPIASLLALTLAALAASAPGCAIKPKDQKVFEDDTQPPRTATRDWNGEAITIHNAGISPENDLGGVEVNVVEGATKVSVQAVFAAHADDDKYPNAAQSIFDAIQTFTLVEGAGRIDIRCGNGETHGTARAVGSGCKTLRVTVPAGAADKPHALDIRTGSGAVRIGIGGGRAPFVKSVVVDDTGPSPVEVRIHPVKDATLSLAGHDVVAVALPEDFSSKKVVFSVADTDQVADGVVTTAFPGMTNGAAYPASGPSPNAANELRVHARGPLETDTIRVTKH